jgi:hypothetical protein
MQKTKKEELSDFDEFDGLEIQPLTDEDLAVVGGSIGSEIESCSTSSCSCF